MWNRYVPLDALFAGSTRDIQTDVFLSQGTVYPPDVYDKWGFVGCMGSVAFRATPGAQTLLRQAIRTCAEGKGLSQSPRSASAIAHTRPAKGLLRPEGTVFFVETRIAIQQLVPDTFLLQYQALRATTKSPWTGL